MRFSILLTIAVILYSCSGKSKQESTTQTNTDDTTKFFQVTEFIQAQVNEVNKTPYFIYKIEESGNKKDSVAIDNKAFNELAKPFLQPDISDPSIKKHYNESLFFDETIKTFTLNYSTTNKELEVQNVDVLLEEDGKTVKRILIRKFKEYPDSSTMEQLSWKPNQSFQVNKLVQRPDKSETDRKTTVVWNEKRG